MNRIRMINGKIVSEKCQVIFDKKVQLLVCGMGTGGVSCAIAAARQGIEVLGIDKLFDIGGMNTVGLINYYYYGYYTGILRELDSIAYEDRDLFISGFQQTELSQCVQYKALEEAGAELMLNTVALGIYMEGNRVCGAELFSENGIINVECRQMVDATSDGHIIRLTGVETYFGRSADGKAVPFSSIIRYIDENDKFKFDTTDCGFFNPFDEKEFTEKILKSRVARNVQNAKINLGLAELPGIREGLRFNGEETLTLKNIIKREQPEKVVVYGYSDIDKHGIDTAVDSDEFQNHFVISNLATVAFRIPVPFGAVIPKNISGITSGCRCLSVDSYASSAVRMVRDIKRLGECVGIGLSIAIKNNCDFSEIDYQKFVELSQNARIGDEQCDVGFDNILDHSKYRPIKIDKSFEEIDAELNSQMPASAIYSCTYNRKKYEEHLLDLIKNSKSKLQKENTALVLGMFERKEALPTLRNMVKNRSCVFLKDCRRSNQFPSVNAICLLGRIGEKEDIKLLEQIVFDEKEFDKELYHTLEPDYLFCKEKCVNYVYYQHFTHSLMAYIKLCKKFDLEIYDKITNFLTGKSRNKIIQNVTTEYENPLFKQSFEDFLDYAIEFSK